MSFTQRYGPWALVAGASDGVGQAFAEGLAARGLNVALLARRQALLDEVAAGIQTRYGVETRAIAMDLAAPDAAEQSASAVADLEVGFLVYCAGAQSVHKHFLDADLAAAESMMHRNCTVPMQLCHHLGQPMVERGRGGIVIFGSGAGIAGAPYMAVYGASKSFDMVFAEGLYGELQPRGVDVLGLILGETDTPALRRLKVERGLHSSIDDPVKGAQSPDEVVEDALAHIDKGPTRLVNPQLRIGLRIFGLLPRNTGVALMRRAAEKSMGK